VLAKTDFNSGYIDLEKWDVDEYPATISVENGKARFDHDLSIPNDSSYLIFKKYPERIRAVMVTMLQGMCHDGQ
jgi:hypothetical protein